MKHEKMDKLPETVLTDITDVSEFSVSSESSNPANLSPVSVVSNDEIFAAGKSAETTPFAPVSGPTDGPKPFASPNPGPTVVSKPMNVGNIVGGKFTVDMLDNMFPAIIVYIVGMIGYSMDKKGLQMTAKEKEIVIPAMQDYLNSVNVNFNNPLYNLLFAVGSVYAAKIIEILPTIEKKNRTAKKEPAKVITMQDKVKEVEQGMKEANEKKAELDKFRSSLRNLAPETAIKMISQRFTKGREWSASYYNKNIKQRK